ncbi:acetoacetate decarboxylase family protein [Hoeflea sp. G2-23]|uniref:Acetoacetate decarboxylase family protein n=1 Tax=Hoeflea algicola TaxID=2983763 RepID=A0ABT3ZBZ3_9HYPH|nr:acetoacetate decarboxylase family protein [Hoeflea algicola]MCY0149319.1 acetoacetate decarboxylase family protein [Hoeflea algicola]MCY0150625.1 acetoacetate decarboxylase family protein [Hoeflea algicola]
MSRENLTDRFDMFLGTAAYPDPLNPYSSNDYRGIVAVCRTDADVVKRILKTTPFEYVDNIFNITFGDSSNSVFPNSHQVDIAGYMHCRFTVPVRYKDIVGGYTFTWFENHFAAVCAGREVWGYPKKLMSSTYEETDESAVATCVVGGNELITLAFDFKSKPIENLPEVKLNPHLMIHTVANPEGPGILEKRILSRDPSPDNKPKFKRTGNVTVALRGNRSNPLDALLPIEVLGGFYSQGMHVSSDEHGWAKIIDQLK